jgi:hypothetical protein
MKNLMLLVLCELFTLIVTAQMSLSNTKWLLHSEIPRPNNTVMEFKKDSAFVFNEAGEQTGSLTFVQRNDSLLVHKVSGTSPCPVGSEGWYKIEWLENGEKFLLHLLDDACPARSRVYPQIRVVKRII